MEDADTSGRNQFILLHPHCDSKVEGVKSTSLDEDVEKLDSVCCWGSVKRQNCSGKLEQFRGVGWVDAMLPHSLCLH